LYTQTQAMNDKQNNSQSRMNTDINGTSRDMRPDTKTQDNKNALSSASTLKSGNNASAKHSSQGKNPKSTGKDKS
jgi:hypothetical protein